MDSQEKRGPWDQGVAELSWAPAKVSEATDPLTVKMQI